MHGISPVWIHESKTFYLRVTSRTQAYNHFGIVALGLFYFIYLFFCIFCSLTALSFHADLVFATMNVFTRVLAFACLAAVRVEDVAVGAALRTVDVIANVDCKC